MEDQNEELSRLVQRGGPGIVLSANVHSLNLCLQLPWLASFYHRADMVYVDGAGVVLGARLLGHRIPRRTTMADWGRPAARYLAEKGHSLVLLGNPPGAAGNLTQAMSTCSRYITRITTMTTTPRTGATGKIFASVTTIMNTGVTWTTWREKASGSMTRRTNQ